ncbi:MAG: helix-turn-helix transcriptional regulator [Deltaproteobacteria bacterium]|nr:helix-turn-helix transcriptional regulator [Deltaproteobacteria bacterium]
MSAPTKRRLTDIIELRFIGPANKRATAVESLKDLGFVEAAGSVPWEEINPFTDDQRPGGCLVGARNKEGLTQVQLAKATGIPQRHISEMENHKRLIGKERAKILGKALNIDYRLFL